MIRPFGLRDVPAVHRLQQDGAWLDLYHYLLHRRTALSTALIAPVPWRVTGLASYVWETDRGVQGFVQMLRRPGGQEAYVLFIAPALERAVDAEAAWEALLSHCVASATQAGIRRLFVNLAENSSEMEVLAGLGFAAYIGETIWRLERPPKAAAPVAAALRQRHPDDAWWLRRLYSRYTPPAVQQAEGMGDNDEPSAWPQAWWELSHVESYVLERGEELAGGVQVVSGRRGHWIILHGNAGDGELMATLLRQGLVALAGGVCPVYCAVRDYQGGLNVVLEDHGFYPFARRLRAVKHMALRVREAQPVPLPSLAIHNLS